MTHNSNAEKIIVIGCPGSGKSTFARRLKDATGLPLCYLDMLYWNPDKTTVSGEVFRERLDSVLREDRWIIDGNYSSTLEARVSVCQRIFFFDLPADVCLEGVRGRIGKARPDMPWTETEEDGEFMDFISSFGTDCKPKILALLEKYPQREVIIFHSRKEADEYIDNLIDQRNDP